MCHDRFNCNLTKDPHRRSSNARRSTVSRDLCPPEDRVAQIFAHDPPSGDGLLLKQPRSLWARPPYRANLRATSCTSGCCDKQALFAIIQRASDGPDHRIAVEPIWTSAAIPEGNRDMTMPAPTAARCTPAVHDGHTTMPALATRDKYLGENARFSVANTQAAALLLTPSRENEQPGRVFGETGDASRKVHSRPFDSRLHVYAPAISNCAGLKGPAFILPPAQMMAALSLNFHTSHPAAYGAAWCHATY